jgi:hypothetical protein
MTEEHSSIEFSALVGEHVLDAVDSDSTQKWEDSFGAASVLRFRLDGIVYTALEDPCDGYRSSMDKIFTSKDSMRNVFPPIMVLARIRTESSGGSLYKEKAEVLQLLDMTNGKVILEVGTDNTDDYYPSFVATWRPENMAVNQG